jgi:PAS domain-containing protein
MESQVKLEDSQLKYFDLYNFALDGYFTRDIEGIILEVNLSGASLLGVGRRDLYELLL